MARIYCGTYGKYNSGSLFGAWMDLSNYESTTEFYAACAELHKGEHDPEFMFQDWEGIPEGMVWEGGISDDLFSWLEMSEHDQKILAAYREVERDATLERAQEAYVGTSATSEADFAEECSEECGELENIPTHLVRCIDWERVAHDMFIESYISVTHDGDFYVFYRL